MTPDQRTELEQVSREWLIASGFCHRSVPDNQLTPVQADVDSLTSILAAQRAAVLEEVLDKGRLRLFFRTLLSQGADMWLDYNAGKYTDYEQYLARLDAAAIERSDQFIKLAQEQRP